MSIDKSIDKIDPIFNKYKFSKGKIMKVLSLSNKSGKVEYQCMHPKLINISLKCQNILKKMIN